MMATLTHAERHIAEQTVCILLLHGTAADGGPAYAYVGVRADKLPDFMAAQQRPGFDPEAYGFILASGAGEPSEAIKAQMEQEYGFDHNALLPLG